MPPGFSGFVMVTEEMGEGPIEKLNFSGDAEDKPDEAQDPLERDFVSRGRGRHGVRVAAAVSILNPASPRTALSEPPAALATSPCGVLKRSRARMPKCTGPWVGPASLQR